MNVKATAGAGLLKAAMQEHLDTGKACFLLYAQFYVDAKRTPIEDFATVWKESDSPLHVVAQVTFPKQAFEAIQQRRHADNHADNVEPTGDEAF